MRRLSCAAFAFLAAEEYIFQNIYYATKLCKSNVEMTPLCKIKVTLPRVLGPRKLRRDRPCDHLAIPLICR